jgi:cytoskeletal protein RodZ
VSNPAATTLKEFGEALKKERVTRKLSLAEIAAETRINTIFLEAIEAGDFPKLPEIYIRSFLREYASIVGLDSEDVVQLFLKISRQKATQSQALNISQVSETLQKSEVRKTTKRKIFSLKNIVFAGVILAGIVVFWLLTNVGSPPRQIVEETPFEEVVQENQPQVLLPSRVESTTTQPVERTPDSLVLEVITQDSVWMSILIDNKRGEEYLFPPKRKKTWVAHDKFIISMGNAGGATFTLNGKSIGSLGRRGSVIRNTVINKATLEEQ